MSRNFFLQNTMCISILCVGSAVFTAPVCSAQDLPIEKIVADLREQEISFETPATTDFSKIEIDTDLRELVQQLDDSSFQQRERATRRLINGRHSLLQMQAILAGDSLTLEQRHRLLEIATEKLLNTPRGALGISMRWLQEKNGEPGVVEVMDLLPELPAQTVLRITDKITQVEGQDLFSITDLQNLTQLRRPGEEIELTVQRVVRDEQGNAVRHADGTAQYKQLTVTLELGSAELLRDPGGGPMHESPVVSKRRGQAIAMVNQFGSRLKQLEMAASETRKKASQMNRQSAEQPAPPPQ